MKRWLTLLASISMQSCLGVVYAWSTFIPALKQEHGVDEVRAGLVFGVCIATFTMSMVGGGVLQRKYGSRRVGAAGGILFLAGYLVGAFSGGSYPLLLGGFGVIAGTGIGLGYVCPLATAIQWFPRHKGVIAGLTVAGFGLGSVFFSKAGLWYLMQGVPVLDVLLKFGVFIGITVVISSMFLFLPEQTQENSESNDREIPLRRILGTRDFQLLFVMIFCGTFGGLLVIGNLKPIGLSIGMSAARATFSIVLFAVGNAAGRVLWGLLYDRVGARSIGWCLMLLAAGGGVMGLPGTGSIFQLSTLLIAFAFGGCFVLFAARVADTYGAHRMGEIYPFVFLGYGIAGLIGPAAGGWLLRQTASPSLATAAVVVVALAGTVAAWLGRPRAMRTAALSDRFFHITSFRKYGKT